jgi:replicative DNA helicase
MTNKSYQNLIVTPDKTRELAHRYIETITKSTRFHGVVSGLGDLDKIVNPLMPGRLMTIMGRPGNGKTSLMAHYIRTAARRRTAENQAALIAPPVFISAEMSVEEILVREIAHIIPVDSSLIERGIVSNWNVVHEAIDIICEKFPVIYIAHSLLDTDKRPRLSVESIMAAMQEIVQMYGSPPEIVAVDYAQRLKLDKVTRDRRIEVSEITETMKDMALAIGTGVILGSQVGRHVDQKRPPVPELADAKETANLEETSDVILSVMRPSKYYKIGEKIPGTQLVCHDSLFYIYVVKQRQGKSGEGVWAWFDMSISKLTNLEVEYLDLNDY